MTNVLSQEDTLLNALSRFFEWQTKVFDSCFYCMFSSNCLQRKLFN